ncbi:hypothetical protein Tco_0600080 [Tanacetum coccineum]|uniref:Uncharacterized protein n=1 Tax=Tanacetum coccineum TaxID=301880 RepID=A0ABQ4WAR7_9ASTR
MFLRPRGFFFLPNPGCPFERNGIGREEKRKLNRVIGYRSESVIVAEVDLVESNGCEHVDAAKKNVNTYTRRRRALSTGSEGVSTARRIFSTAEESVSTVGASMPVSTAGMVQQVNIIIPSSSETTKTTKDKGKAIMQESEQPKKIKKRVQIQMSLDEELAQKFHEEEQARFNAEQEAKFNAEQEELLATQIQADEDLAQKLLEGERENLSIDERARLLAELIDKRKKLQAS